MTCKEVSLHSSIYTVSNNTELMINQLSADFRAEYLTDNNIDTKGRLKKTFF